MNENMQISELAEGDPCGKQRSYSVAFERHEIWDAISMAHAGMDAYQEAIIKTEVESPNLARSYAQTIVSSWRSMQASASLQENQPCYLLELEATNGKFACWLLNALERLLSAREWDLFSPQYLLADSRPERISECWQHPALHQWIERGHLEPVEYDPRRQRFIDLKSRRLILGSGSIANPLTVLANGVFSGLRQSLYNIHYGKCFSARLASTASAASATQDDSVEKAGEPNTSLSYHWREMQTPQHTHALLPRYIERLDSGVVLLPDETIEVIGRITMLAGNGVLFLLSDRGFYSEADLRQQWIPEMGPCARYFLPINGHALSWHVESLNGNAAHYQSGYDSALHSMLWCPTGMSGAQLDTRQLTDNFSNSRDATVRRMSELAAHAQATISAEQLLALLDLSNFDHGILFAHLDCLRESLPHLDARQRIRWRSAMEKVWQQYYSLVEDAEFLTEFGLLSMRLGAWGVAKRSLSYVVERLPGHIASNYYLAATLLHLGERDSARQVIHRCLAMNPSFEDAIVLSRQLSKWQLRCQEDSCYDATLGRDREISLHPLAEHYAEEFLYQYRDPSIAVMTSLPDFDDVESFEKWQSEQYQPDNKGLYIIVHREHGLLGVVSLRWHRDMGFFYFWIGTDYQGQGIGQRAARLLFNMAQQTLGIRDFYTCVFRDNSRSISALEKLGFKQLPFTAKEPDEDYLFCHRSRAEAEGRHSYTALTELLNKIESPIKLEPIR